MNVFLDANILVSVITREQSTIAYTSFIISQKSSRFRLITSSVCMAIAWYFACKKFTEPEAKRKLSILNGHLDICISGPEEVSGTFSNKRIHDVEDGIQYYSAIKAGCSCIITEDINDFYFSEIEVLSSRSFFDKYLVAQ